jgi:protocatechuate 3,4-dioxygenase beta subunit
MQRTSPLLVVLLAAVFGGLGWLAHSVLSSDGSKPAPIVAVKPEARPEPVKPKPKEPDPAPATAPPTVAPQRVPVDPPDPKPMPVDPLAGAPGAILGRVVDPSGAPISGVEVELEHAPIAGPAVRTFAVKTGQILQTDASGQYQFEGVEPAEDYVVFASHPQHGDSEGGPFVVKPGEKHVVGDIVLRKGILLQGVVTRDGRPVDTATVTVRNAMERARRMKLKRKHAPADDEEPWEENHLTDARGHYEFAEVPVTTFEVSAAAEGLATITRWPQQTFGFGNGAAAHSYVIDFELVPAKQITGRVVDDRKNPMAGAKVVATWSSSAKTTRCESEAKSDASGAFTVGSLCDAAFQLSAELDGFSTATRAQVDAGTTEVELVLRAQGGVSGVVVDEETGRPVGQFELAVQPSANQRGPGTRREHLSYRDGSGRFEVKNVEPGFYQVTGSASGYADSTSDEFEVKRGATTPLVKVAMNRGGGITGRVVDPDKNPVPGAKVVLRDNKSKDNPVTTLFAGITGEVEKATRTDDEGTFRFDLVVPGTYQVAVRSSRLASHDVDDVDVVKGKVRELGDVELARGARVTGHAYDLDGKPLVSAKVTAISTTRDWKEALTDNSGTYVLENLVPGEYTISITSFQSNPPDPPLSPFVQVIYGRNSAQKMTLTENGDVAVDLRITRDNPHPAPARDPKKPHVDSTPPPRQNQPRRPNRPPPEPDPADDGQDGGG